MKTILLAACCFLIIHSGFNQSKTASSGKPAQKADTILAGKTFKVTIIEKGAKKNAEHLADEISFRGGKINPLEKIFPVSVYEVKADSLAGDSAITFTAKGKKPDGDVFIWQGRSMPGGAMEGRIRLYAKGKVKKEYDFAGALKTKKKK